jgi:TPR repeat protein
LFFNETKEFEQAFGWFSKAAERGYTRAITNLGICFELGCGIEKDWDQALKLYSEGAEKGHL